MPSTTSIIKTMLLAKVTQIFISLLFLSLTLTVTAEEDDISSQNLNVTSAVASASPFLKKTMGWPRPRPPRPSGCRFQPWICRQRWEFPQRWRCCRNQCVELSSDVNNCGFCGVTCPFGWQCCRGRCVNTNVNPFNCGRCGNRCPFGIQCLYGMCGYDQPPFPFPPRPPRPFPPFPPRPPRPFPPRPPRPQPPPTDD